MAGKIAQVNLYLPEPGNRGAGFHFRKKILGFGDLTETFAQMDSAGDDIETALGILALVVGILHFGNVWCLNAFRRRAMLRAQAVPPVAPNRYTPVATPLHP